MQVFFRVDDLGWDAPRFLRLASLFSQTGHRLNAAAIPTESSRQAAAEALPASVRPSVQIVAHGYSHRNHMPEGKKSEFGTNRSAAEVERDLREGRARLEEVYGKNFFPCFVPPWNRFEERHRSLLAACGYVIFSADGPASANPGPLMERNISLDLHTRRDKKRFTAGEVRAEIEAARERGAQHYGLMLHHTHMDEADFNTLGRVLGELTEGGVRTHFFSDLMPTQREGALHD